MRVLIVDDHAMVRRGLRRYLELIPEAAVVAEAASGIEALALAFQLAPDLILLDVMMPQLDGIAAAQVLRLFLPDTKIIVLTACYHDEQIQQALQVGVNGLLLKDVGIDELELAMRTVCVGQPYLQPAVARQLIGRALRPAPAPPRLTSRERQVYDRLARGLSNRQIADELRVSEKTISVHVSNLMGKLGVRSRTQAALAALEARAA